MDIYLGLFSILAIFCAILVIINKNPIVSVLFLIGLFLFISAYLILLGMNFIGISYLLVYIGAVSILFLFILMLINIRISEIQIETSTSLPLALIVSANLYIYMYDILPYNFTEEVLEKFNLMNNYKQKSSWDENFVLCPEWDTNLVEMQHITSIGNVLYTNYFLWLILTSVILLLAMIGTIIITIKNE